MVHLADIDRHAYLTALRPGSDLHHPGTAFDAALLGRLLDAVRDPATEQPLLGDVDFAGAIFEDDAMFERATFRGDAVFTTVTFWGNAQFGEASFRGEATFRAATFRNKAVFSLATFAADASFYEASFQGFTRFDAATFEGEVWWSRADFEDHAAFDLAHFEGDLRFDRATFHGGSGFHSAAFHGRAEFNMATFQGNVDFGRATFHSGSGFGAAAFHGYAGFDAATFQGDAEFRAAAFHGYAEFDAATFHRNALFLQAAFHGRAGFDAATFQRDAVFLQAAFERASLIGPLACWGTVDFTAAVFGTAVIVEAAARGLDCRRTRWASTAALRLRHAAVDVSDAVVEYPVSITARATPFPRRTGEKAVDESGIDPDAVRIVSLRGVDAAHLSLTDVGLTTCRFAGTVHLDQLRVYGLCPLPSAPGGWHRRGLLPVRFTARQTLAEEQHWRAARPGAAAGWTPQPDDSATLEPAALMPLYRELRKAFEDGKNEPGAADFYYGEMEMRRHDPRTPAAERFLLHLYWAVSGYGLRASRALGWLLAAMAATVALMMGFGLPDSPAEPYPPSAGVIGEQNPELHATFADRFTGARAQKAADVVVNSVVFRSSGQDLTTVGRYTEMASRFTEPVLLALAVLAVRGRVKR